MNDKVKAFKLDDSDIDVSAPHGVGEPERLFEKQKPFYKKPVPMILLVVFMLALGGIYLNKKASMAQQSKAKEGQGQLAQKPKSPLELLEDKVTNTFNVIAQQDKDLLAKITNLGGQIDTQSSELSKKAEKSDLSQLNNKVTGELSGLHDNIAAINQKMAELKKTQASLLKNAKRHEVTTSRMVVHVPFKLVSIDVWNGVPNAAIVANDGHMALIGPGDDRMGWRATTIDYRNNRAVFKHLATGALVTLHVVM